MAQLYEYNQTETGNTRSIYGVYWGGQTFTVSSSHYITSVKTKMQRAGDCSAYTLTAHLRATSGNLPSGVDLSSGSRGSLNDFPTSGSAWGETPVTQYLLSATVYAICLSMNGDSTHKLVWMCANTNPYAGGRYTSSNDGGSTWTGNDSWDYTFEIWGLPPTVAPTVTTQAASSIGLD